jgi:hypothetical protein
MNPTVGLARLAEPLRGTWELSTFPELVTLLGRTFRRASWAAPYPGVIAQYREDVDRVSLHLMVHADKTWIIDHTDDANPDRGLVLEHTFRDVAQTPVGGGLLVAALFLTAFGLSWALTRS